MSYRLFIDDERDPPEDGVWFVARTSDHAKAIVRDCGLPNYISFDHDLGGDDTAMVFLRWLIDYMFISDLQFAPDFGFYVHSQNPIGRENIAGLLDGFLAHQAAA